MAGQQSNGECRDLRDFARMVRCFRGRRNWTQEHLADRAGVSAKTVGAWETGIRRQVQEKTLDLLLNALELEGADRAALIAAVREPRSDQEPPSALPSPPTSFVGRTELAKQLAAEVRAAGHACLTLIGPGGVGKTRLALHVATELERRFEDGARFIRLAPLTNPDQAPRAILQALGLPIDEKQPELEQVKQDLGPRRLLLVLDNCEHLLPDVAVLVGDLLDACPRLVVLATSREPLAIYGERVHEVGPLDLPAAGAGEPDLERLGENEAVALFVDRARAGQALFTLTAENAAGVVEVCARLDGLPLAIELGAARLASLGSVETLLRRLEQRLPVLDAGWRDRGDRQRTMRGAIAWSYDLLEEPDQRAFRRLAVFTGGCTAEAAAHLCAIAPEHLTAADVDALVDLVVEPLVSKSLLRHRPGPADRPRFAMFQTIREFGLAALSPEEEADARLRLAEWLVAFAEARTAASRGPEPKAVLNELEAEMPNLRSAFGWLTGDGVENVELALRLGSALWPFWKQRSYLGEGRRVLEQAIAQSNDKISAVSARCLIDLANSDGISREKANALYEASAEIYMHLDDSTGLVRALVGCGMVANDLGSYEQAREHLRRAHSIVAATGDLNGNALVESHLGLVEVNLGHHDEARVWLLESYVHFKEAGDALNERLVLLQLGWNALIAGEDAEAAQLLSDCLRLCERAEFEEGIGHSLVGLGLVALRTGTPQDARSCLQSGLALLEPLLVPEYDLVVAVEGFAGAALRLGRPGLSVQLLAATQAWRDRAPAPRHRIIIALRHEHLELATSMLPAESFHTAWEQGNQLSLDEVVAMSLSTVL